MSSTYTANRFFGGSMFFPLLLHFLGEKVSFVKPGLFTTWERTIPLSKVPSLVERGLIIEIGSGPQDPHRRYYPAPEKP